MEQKRKYFGTDGIRGTVGQSNINPEFVLKLGWAVGKVLTNGARKKVLIGKDTRISGYLLESALEAGLSAAGVDIHLLGPMPTPAIAYLTRTLRAQAGIVISASHNLYSDNGIKFFNADGHKLANEVEALIEKQIEQPMVTVASELLGKAKRVVDARGRYIEFCKSTIPSKTRLSGLKIAVDCANGATYHVAPDVFRELGAEVIEVGVQPDGYNINANSGSTKPEIVQALVKEHEADVGIAFDGDGDRVIMVDHEGNVVDGDEILFIIAKDQQRHGLLQGGVVGTLMSNIGLEIALQQLGLPFVRTNVGDRHVIDTLLKRGWSIGGESSGHVVCLDKTTTGDGIVTALQVLYAMTHDDLPLKELKEGMEKHPQYLINVKTQHSSEVIAHPQVQKLASTIEGELNGSGRVLLRASGTEPVARVMVEGMDSKKILNYAQQLADVVTVTAHELANKDR